MTPQIMKIVNNIKLRLYFIMNMKIFNYLYTNTKPETSGDFSCTPFLLSYSSKLNKNQCDRMSTFRYKNI